MSELAQQIIAENRRTQHPTLDLGNCGLTELPDLSGMDWVETLILSDWWLEFDVEKREWTELYSQNNGRENQFKEPLQIQFHWPFLKKLVANGLAIRDTCFLEKLTGLNSLNLSNNQIKNGHSLENLTQLTTLYIYNNEINDAGFLENLTGLNSLNLGNNQIKDGRFFQNLPQLTTLELGGNQIICGPLGKNCPKLISLSLRNNQIRNGDFLIELPQLIILDLSSNQINDGRFLEKLTQLTKLNLSDNQITDGHFLEKLLQLTTLDLSYNIIIEWPFWGDLTKLTSLNLSDSQIIDTLFLEKLTELTTLNLRHNQIKDWHFLRKLTKIRDLSLSDNQISDNQISDAYFWENLTQLTSLNLSFNEISDAHFLGKLTGLTSLDLSKNQISNAQFLEKLTSLTSLNLSKNQISNARFLEKLTSLTSLNISKNKIEDLSPVLHLVEKGIPVVWSWLVSDEIGVQDNPFSTPPIEIVQQGNEAILNYFKQIEEQGGTTPLYEARLIMVGEPGAGKTSLTEKLLDEKHAVKPDDPDKKSTIGINVKENWRFEDCRRSGEDFTAHIWDFGGQEIQYMTHQFFLTPESMYVLVADDRKQHTLFPYWFEVIRLLGKDEAQGHSPVLVVLNERNNKSITNFDLNEYRLRYPDMNIQVCEVDLCEDNLSRFRWLRQQVQETLCHLPHIGRALPAKWPLIREDLAKLKEQGHNHITMSDFRAVCAAHKVERDEDLALISLYLHRLGAILHFQQDRSLRDFIVISPAWALKAMYAVLEDKAVEKANGFFTDQDLDRYWSDLTDKERDNVLKMMKKESFEIVYPVEGGYIAPQLLSKVRPLFKWDGKGSLKCRFYYRFMPKGILTRLIVRKHAHIKDQALVWARGAVLHFAGCDILVVEQETEKDGVIQIEVQGKGREGIRALDFVRNEIEEIHRKWFSNIDFQPMVPCDCEDCQRIAEPTYFKLESLIKRLDQNRHEIECENKRVKDVPVRRLLEGVYHESDIARKMEHRSDMHIHVHAEDRKVHEKLDDIKRAAEHIEVNTHIIQSNQHVHSRHLEALLQLAEDKRAMVEEIVDKIELLSAADTVDFRRIDQLLEEQFGKLLERLPDEHQIAAAWKAATESAPEETDMKWTLKFKIPLIFAEFEKDLSWDGKKMLKSIREEFVAYYKGDRSFKELFWED